MTNQMHQKASNPVIDRLIGERDEALAALAMLWNQVAINCEPRNVIHAGDWHNTFREAGEVLERFETPMQTAKRLRAVGR